MTVRRLVVGLGVGSAAMIMPLYIAEVAPAKYRGRMIGLDNMSITGGQLVNYGIGAALASVAHGWRAMVAIGAVPAIVLLVSRFGDMHLRIRLTPPSVFFPFVLNRLVSSSITTRLRKPLQSSVEYSQIVPISKFSRRLSTSVLIFRG